MILGIHTGHNTAAALVDDAGIHAAAEEERFDRLKHSDAFPINAIRYCLDRVDEPDQEIDHVAVSRSSPSTAMRKHFGTDTTFRAHGELAAPEPGGVVGRATTIARERPLELPLAAIRFVVNDLLAADDPPPTVPGYAREFGWPTTDGVDLVNHHEAHAASAYYTCGSTDALVVTLDGRGDEHTGTVWRGHDGSITPLATYPWGGSLGWFYGLVTEALGWFVGNGEGKTMGLAAFTEPSDEVVERLRTFCPVYRDGELVTPREFDPKSFRAYGGLHFTFERREAVREIVDEFGREPTAAAAQALLEEQVFEIVEPWIERTGLRTVTTAGGVFMNVTLNRRLQHHDAIDSYAVFPAARDGGLAAGAALAAQAVHGRAPTATLEHVYYGPSIEETVPDSGSIADHLRRRGIPFEQPADVPETVADRLAAGDVVAWCRGRMEYGPRALGRRSILSDPTRPDSKDRVNERVKFREGWRPFAPSILERAVEDYFVDPAFDPFMITSCEVRPEKRDEIPAVVHVDGTSRPQMVRRSVVPDYWALIDAFAARTGVPVLLNTSYNLSGDPIVCSVDDAIQTFYDCGLDLLVVGDCVVSKSGEPIDSAGPPTE